MSDLTPGQMRSLRTALEFLEAHRQQITTQTDTGTTTSLTAAMLFDAYQDPEYLSSLVVGLANMVNLAMQGISELQHLPPDKVTDSFFDAIRDALLSS